MQNHLERILAEWVGELAVTIHRGREVTGFAQDDTGVNVALSDGQSSGSSTFRSATSSRLRRHS